MSLLENIIKLKNEIIRTHRNNVTVRRKKSRVHRK
jgi:hypothetical protein